MRSRAIPSTVIGTLLALAVAGAGFTACARSDAKTGAPTQALDYPVVAGGPNRFCEVRHVVLRGSNREIGAALAKLARERHGVDRIDASVPENTRAQREWFEAHYGSYAERMRGVAETQGILWGDDRHSVAGLPYGFGDPGCTVFYVPAERMQDGKAVVSRNFDFTTGSMDGRRQGAPVCSRPYLLELHPEGGFASLGMACYDLLGGLTDGMNSEGLVVALLADDEIQGKFPDAATHGPRAGLSELQIVRYLLDTCASAAEARRALELTPLYYVMIPCHYLVADRFGNSFVWENSPSGGAGCAIQAAAAAPLITSNFMLQLHPAGSALPEEPSPFGMFRRYLAVRDGLEDANTPTGRRSLDEIREIARSVQPTGPAPPAPWAPGRTLWHALYTPADRSVEIDFYLGESLGRISRSEYRRYVLGS